MRIATFCRAVDSPGGAEESMRTLRAAVDDRHEVESFESPGDDVFRDIAERAVSRVGLGDDAAEAVGHTARFAEPFFDCGPAVPAFDPDLVVAQHESALFAAVRGRGAVIRDGIPSSPDGRGR